MPRISTDKQAHDQLKKHPQCKGKEFGLSPESAGATGRQEELGQQLMCAL